MKRICILLLYLLIVPASLAGWKSSGLAGKSVLCVAVNPSDKNLIFTGVRDEGIYSSTDGGTTWFLSYGKGSIFSIVIDRSDPRVVYAGMEGSALRSRDGGNSFVTMTKIDNITVNCIAIDETQSKAVILGTSQGVFKSLDGGKTFLKAGLEDQNISSLAINNRGVRPIIYAATEGAGVFKTANYGLAWTPANKGLNDLVIYSIICNLREPSKLLMGTLEAGIYQSDDNAESWTPSTLKIASRQGYALAQAVDARQGGSIVYAANFSGEVFKSSDNGLTWKKIGEPLKDIAGLCLGIANVIPTTLYLGTGQGLYKLEEK